MDTPDKWFISNTNMLRGMLCFGVKCECVYSPLEEDMLCAVCSIWSSQPQTRGRGGVQASAPRTFIWCACSPVWLCRVPDGGWMCVSVSVLECSRKKKIFSLLSGSSSVSKYPVYPSINTYILDIMIQCSTHCTAYHKVYRFCFLKVMEPMFMFPTSTIKDPVFTDSYQPKQGLMFSSMTNDFATA